MTLVITETAFLVVFGILAARASCTIAGRLLVVPLLWSGLEIARARYPLGGFSWGVIGYTQHGGGSLLPLARVGGVVLLGLAIVAVSALIAEALTSRPAGTAVLVLAIGGGVLLPRLLPLGLAGRAAGTLDVA